jgi:cellulose synthase/poly-beta-1,6-N-acetylglucosamine synthase-like glycosyltransferase
MPTHQLATTRVRRFRIKYFFASKRNEAKQDLYRFVFACSSKNKGPIFSLRFASIFSLRFASPTEYLLHCHFKMKICVRIFSMFFYCNFLVAAWVVQKQERQHWSFTPHEKHILYDHAIFFYMLPAHSFMHYKRLSDKMHLKKDIPG